MHHLLKHESWPRLEGVVSPFFSGKLEGKETPKLVLVRAFHLLVCRTGTGDGCMFLLELRASESKPRKMSEAQLYIFEDNEAVIKTIIKDRSPMMRHVSRTHRVA